MGKNNNAEKAQVVEEVVETVATEVVVENVPVMTVVKDQVVEPRRLTLDERIQKVEDLTLMIDKWKKLSDSRRKLQTFQIGADSLSSVISLKDANGNEFKTSNSGVITEVIEVMKSNLDVKIREVEGQIDL